MNESADIKSAASLIDQLLDLFAEGTVNRDGSVTVAHESLRVVAALTSAVGSGALYELRFDEPCWITTRQAARLLGCSSRWIRELISRNGVSAQRFGARWLVDKASVERRRAETATARPETGEPEPPETGTPTSQEGTRREPARTAAACGVDRRPVRQP